MAKVAHVKDIREHAKSASLQAVAGASALSIVSSARSLADAGFSLEHDGDLSGALYKYSQAANLLEHVLGTAEYKRETPKGQRGVLYQQTAKLSEYITGQMLPRAKKIEERLKEIEHTQPVPEPDARPMGSVADRMKMLAQAGMDVRGAGPPPKPAKPPKLHDPRPPPDLKPKSDAIDLGPAPLNPTSPGGGASSIQHELGFLNDLDARPNGKMPPLVPSAPIRPPGMFPASSSNSPIGMFGITPSAPPARSRGGSNTSATSTTTATMTVTQPSAPPRSPRSMSLHITSPTLTTNNLGALAPSPSLTPNQEQPSPTKSPRPPVPPRLTPTSTGNAPRSIAGDRTPPTRSSTLGTSTPPLSKSALWSSPQHTGTSINGIGIVTNGTGGRSQPLSPLATGGDSLGLGLGLRTDLGELREDDERPAKPQRSATTEAFETAYPSIDAIEANFPSIDSLEASFPSVGTLESSFPSVESMEATDAELKLLKASVPSSVPGTMPALTGPTSPPSVGFEFGRTFSGKDSISPTPRSFPNAIPDLDGPRPASTPANGRPGVTFGSAAKTPQRTPDPPKLDKLPKPDLPITNVVNAQKLKSYLGTALQILVLDVRPREDFEARRMPVDNLVCIEPILLTRKGMSTKELQEALVLSSKTERTLFERRNTFDLVVLCDEGSTSFGDPSTPLGVLFRIIYETEFLKPLRRSPVFLYGGIRAWGNDVGEFVGSQAKEDVVVAQSPDASKRLSRKPAVSNRPASNSVSHARMPQDAGLSGSSFARTPIAYPERAVSPPTSSGTPTQSHRPIEDMMSPPPPMTAGYFEPPHHAYSGSVTLSTTRPASIDYPNLIRPPPIAAAPTMERVDSRPRMQPPKPPQFQPDYQVVYWRDEQLGMSGLRNMGNTCYMNSVLQCLSATVPFTRFFTDRRWHHEVNMMNPLGTRGELAGAFYSLLRDMWQGELPYLTPIPFRKSICQHARQFAGTEQHDAQEFLIFLLDGIHEDLNRIIIKPQFEELTAKREAELEAMPKQLAGAHEWARYRRRNDSIVVDYFQGQFCNRMQCFTCGQTSTTYNAFLNLSVPIPVSKGTSKVSLTDCINALVNKEVMDNADAWHCPRCKTARRAVKQLTFSRMSPMLIIHLKRFSFKGPFTDKLETLVEFPLKDLDLTAYMPPPLTPNMDKDGLEKYAPTDPRAQIPPYRYELYGVTNHFGSLSSGHYTAFVKSRGKWMYCDDSRITPADTKEVVGKPAYILFYKRVPSGQ